MDEAFHWLHTSFEQRDGLLVYLRVGPVFDCLRSDQRFSELLGRMGFREGLVLPVEHCPV
ncbi:MAG: hypothetical protein DMG70_03865 [Acidobacteria bacterium]|nr:MAG: hypothetical protein DMG70_03865 [Acidobacteriota bacterium]PYY05843.1 MAG: hypothetical protein DMG69_25325 [Acidobacteriota bacterium]